jgi:tetratricopeptide (TPR) repeat protein
MVDGRTNFGLSVTNNVGVAHMYLGQFEEAEACFRRNLRLVASTYFNLGLTLVKQGRYEEALPHLRRGVEIEPTDPQYLDLLGDTYQRLGQLTEAREVLEKAIAVDKAYARAHYDLGVVFARMEGKQKEALKCFRRAIACDSELAYAHYAIACIYALKGKKRLALRFLEQALQKGCRDYAYLQKDSDLDCLREEPKFQELEARYLSGGTR